MLTLRRPHAIVSRRASMRTCERAGGRVAAQNNIISMHDWLGNVNDRRECARQCCERLKLETTTVVVMDWMLLQH